MRAIDRDRFTYGRQPRCWPRRMLSKWLSPPSLRSTPEQEDPRHATWLELFYDLVFVVTVARLAELLVHDLTGASLARFLILFVPVWWAWIGSTYYATRFDPDDLGHRLLTAVEMLAVIALATSIDGALGSESAAFALAYGTVRAILVAKYLRAGWHVPDAHPLVKRFGTGFAMAAALWFASLLVPVPYRFGVWGLALLVSFATPTTAGRLHVELPPHVYHLPERLGLFTIIVLGESIVAVVLGLSEQVWTATTVATAVAGLAIAFSLWWVYFEHQDGSAIRAAQVEGRVGLYQVWLYAHLPFVVGLTAAGAAVSRVLQASPGASLPSLDRWLLTGAIAMCLLALGLLHHTTQACAGRAGHVGLRSLHRFGTAVLVLLLGAFGEGLGPLPLTVLVAAACVAQVVIDTSTREPTSSTTGPG